MPTTYAIPNGRTVFDATLFTSTGSAQTITNQYGFKPDFIWQKARSQAYAGGLIDSVRGANQIIYSSLTNSEATATNAVNSFNSNGFTGGGDAIATNGNTVVAWQWQAGQGSNTTNTTGTITATVSANANAGFSIVTWAGTGSSGTIGHGLGVTPSMVMVKNRTSSQYWFVNHSAISATQNLYLNTNDAVTSDGVFTSRSSTTVGIGSGVSTSSNNYVAYCWAQVAGFSAFGSYTGNGSYGGPFVYTGFRPKFVMLKMTSSTNPWQMYDSSRDPYNYSYHILAANSSAAEDSSSGAGVAIDLLSNGFKIRTDWADINTNGGSYIYMAWAENPFKYATAR